MVSVSGGVLWGLDHLSPSSFSILKCICSLRAACSRWPSMSTLKSHVLKKICPDTMVGLMFPSPFRMCSSFTSLMHYFFHFFEWQQFIYVLMSVRLAYALRKTFWLSHLKKYFVTAIIFHSFNKCSPVFTCLLGACVSCLCVPSLFLHQFLSWLSLIVSFSSSFLETKYLLRDVYMVWASVTRATSQPWVL